MARPLRRCSKSARAIARAFLSLLISSRGLCVFVASRCGRAGGGGEVMRLLLPLSTDTPLLPTIPPLPTHLAAAAAAGVVIRHQCPSKCCPSTQLPPLAPRPRQVVAQELQLEASAFGAPVHPLQPSVPRVRVSRHRHRALSMARLQAQRLIEGPRRT